MKPALLILFGYGLVIFFVITFDLYRNGPLLTAILAVAGFALAWLAGDMFFKAGRINFWAALAAVLLLGLMTAFTRSTVPFGRLGNWMFGILVTLPIVLVNILAACRCLWLRRRA